MLDVIPIEYNTSLAMGIGVQIIPDYVNGGISLGYDGAAFNYITRLVYVYDKKIRKTAKKVKRQIFVLSLITEKKVNPDKISSYLGVYRNDVLGEVKLVLHNNNSLWVDFGEYESEVRHMLIGNNQYIFSESIFIGKTMTISIDQNKNPTMKWQGDEEEYNFSKMLE